MISGEEEDNRRERVFPNQYGVLLGFVKGEEVIEEGNTKRLWNRGK